jgi:hypothetical protein
MVALDKTTRLRQSGVMLQRLLQVCLFAIVTLFLVGEGLACPHHATAPTEETHGLTHGVPAGRSADVAAPQQLATPEGPVLREVAHVHAITSIAHPLRTVTTSWAVADVGQGRLRDCCDTLSGCCAAAPSILTSSGRLDEQKLALHAPHRPAIALVVPPTVASMADDDENRRRWRDTEAPPKTLYQSRLARVARLTI